MLEYPGNDVEPGRLEGNSQGLPNVTTLDRRSEDALDDLSEAGVNFVRVCTGIGKGGRVGGGGEEDSLVDIPVNRIG